MKPFSRRIHISLLLIAVIQSFHYFYIAAVAVPVNTKSSNKFSSNNSTTTTTTTTRHPLFSSLSSSSSISSESLMQSLPSVLEEKEEFNATVQISHEILSHSMGIANDDTTAGSGTNVDVNCSHVGELCDTSVLVMLQGEFNLVKVQNEFEEFQTFFDQHYQNMKIEFTIGHGES